MFAAGSALLVGCATGGPKTASGDSIPAQVILDAEQQADREGVPQVLRPFYVSLYSEGRQNSVLHSMRGGLMALRCGYYDRAEQLFDRAIREVEALQEGAAQAERAKSKFVAEQEKWFKGESYERAALYFYRGLLYMYGGDLYNAAACFKRSEINDITGDDAKGFAGDWVSDEYGLGLADYLTGQPNEAKEALDRAAKYSTKQGDIPPPSAKTNLLIVVEAGDAPIKYRTGKQQERLNYAENTTPIKRVRALYDGNALESAAAENLYVQASTRGTRQVDYILKDKAEFKEDTANATLGLAAGAIVASQVDKSGISSGVLALAAIGTAVASGMSDARADIRAWDNLPNSVYLLNLEVSPTTESVTIQALDKGGGVISTRKVDKVQELLRGKKLAVVFLRV